MNIFQTIVKDYPLSEWIIKHIQPTALLCTFLSSDTFTGTYAKSFQENFITLVRKQNIDELKIYLRNARHYFPELVKLPTKEYNMAQKYVKYETLTFSLVLRGKHASFASAWDEVVSLNESDIIKAIMLKPFCRDVMFRYDDVTYLYDRYKLALALRDGKFPTIKKYYSLDVALVSL